MNGKQVWRLIRTVLLAVLYIAIIGLSGELYLKWKGYHFESAALGNIRFDYRAVADDFHRKFRNGYPSVLKAEPRKKALVLGCSFTYGVGVKEQETFCWKLNDMQSQYRFVNCGIPGMGIGTALLDLSYQLQTQPCDLIVYAAIANHVYREEDLRVVADIDPPALLHQNQSRYLCTDHFPVFLKGGLHRLDLFWFHRLWWGEMQSRLVHFAHRAWIVEQGNLPDEICLGASLGEKRFRYNLRALYTVCAQRKLPLVIVDLFGFQADASHAHDPSYCQQKLEDFVSTPLITGDVVPEIPIIMAEYPVNYLSRPELHTEYTPGDYGDHPSALVHKYYAEKIWAGLQELKRAGKI